MTSRVDALVAGLASVRDEELTREVHVPEAVELLATIVESPPPRPRRGSRRVVWVALAALVLAAALSIPALGVGKEIVSLFAGRHDPAAPVPTASDVLIASGEAGVPWKIVATTSDQGLCLGLYYRAGQDRFGPDGCGYTDVRGDLPSDVRGDPASKCIATPTSLVPCGSLPLHWIGPVGGEDPSVGLEGLFAFGPLAADVASVELLLENGETVQAHVVAQPKGLPLNFYWATWPGPALELAVARNAEGRVLERRVPAWNGNPTGDPDGPAPPEPVGESRPDR